MRGESYEKMGNKAMKKNNNQRPKKEGERRRIRKADF